MTRAGDLSTVHFIPSSLFQFHSLSSSSFISTFSRFDIHVLYSHFTFMIGHQNNFTVEG